MNDQLKVTFDLSHPDIGGLIELLATNDEFRAELAESPETVLAQYGLDVPHALVPSDVQVPDKEDVEQLRQLLAAPRKGVPEIPCLWLGLAILSRAVLHRGGAGAS